MHASPGVRDVGPAGAIIAPPCIPSCGALLTLQSVGGEKRFLGADPDDLA